ncbi:S1/P1 nuclease [Rhypophila decipiens]
MHSIITWGLLAAAPALVTAWGDVGHRTVGYLAEKYFTPKAAAIYTELLANDQGYDISDAATWADTIKPKMPWTKPWHYINPKGDAPPHNCTVEWPDDCKDKKGCIVSAILNYTNILLDTSDQDKRKVDRKNATMFLLHLIGDLHQPLHATGFEEGGNGVKVCWNREPNPTCEHSNLNLHSVWDGRILHKLRGLPVSMDNPREKVAARQWADELFERLQGDAKTRGPDDECADVNAGEECILRWTKESNALVCSHVLARGVQFFYEHDLAEEYYEENKELAEEQVVKAGVRLAAWLNAIAEQIQPEEDEGHLGMALKKEKVMIGDL